ncbi:MAG: zinc-dependent alcohol dehydrogenase family protein [Verrucomicrobiota bacterium]
MKTSSDSNRVVRVSKLGAADVLRIAPEPVREPAAGEVRLRVHAIGLNRAEIMFRTGMYTETPQFPARIGSEAAGVIEAVGAGVSHFKPGDRVSTFPGFSMNRYGVAGDTAVVPASHVVKIPAALSFEEGAAIWTQFLTAYGCLVLFGGLRKGDAVAITAASSSVGVAAIQTVNDAGGVSIAITRKEDKRAALLAAGAHHVIVSETEDLDERVAELTGARGARIVFDPVAGPFLEKLAGIVAAEGIIIEYGWLQPGLPVFPLVPALVKGFSVRGFHLSYQITPHPDRLAAALQYILPRLESGAFRPLLAERKFTLSQIADAYSYMESNEHLGKIVVTNPPTCGARLLNRGDFPESIGHNPDETLDNLVCPGTTL